jgi:hypothetical protein
VANRLGSEGRPANGANRLGSEGRPANGASRPVSAVRRSRQAQRFPLHDGLMAESC